ncbi:MAG: T9SS type A sorting domain-containing protein [Bacteroidetes bacterium]|nr:T9SS type A sorting domain-containing protein [Bacteroidota bacterium]
MKKAILTFLAGITCFILSAQTYNKMLVKDTTSWQHFNCYIPVIAPGQQPATPNFGFFPVVAIDTITINNLLYKKVYQLANYGLNYTGKQFKGYMREDSLTRRVYFKESTIIPEILIYDFSLNVADSTYYSFPNSSNLNGYYRVDSIIVKTEVCGSRKHFYLKKHVNQNPVAYENYLEHIESIGSTFHALYNYNFNGYGGCQFQWASGPCKHLWELGLACKSDKKSKKYQSCTVSLVNSCIPHYDSCNYGNVCSGIRTYKLNKDVSIYPNPTSNKLVLTINLAATETLNIKVYDITGKELLSYKNVTFNEGENTYELNTSGLDNGVYSIVLENQSFKNSYPIVIQK